MALVLDLVKGEWKDTNEKPSKPEKPRRGSSGKDD